MTHAAKPMTRAARRNPAVDSVLAFLRLRRTEPDIPPESGGPTVPQGTEETAIRAPAAPAKPASADRLGFIDALRGFGALYILVFHITLIPVPSLDVPGWARSFILNGGTGVTLFFLLSAFTLMLSMRRHAADFPSWKSFLLRRFFRLAPLFYAWIVVSLIRDGQFGLFHSLRSILFSATFSFNLIPGETQGFVWASWILGVEVLFYLLFPVLYRFVNSLWKSLALIGVSAALSSAFSYCITHFTQLDSAVQTDLLFFSFPTFLPVFAVGMAVFFLYEKYIQNHPRPWGWGVLGILCAGMMFYVVLENRIPADMDFLFFTTAAYAVLILGLAAAPVKLLVNPVSRFLGEISYSIYLNHPTLVWAFLMLGVYRYVYSFSVPRTIQFGAVFFLTLGVVLVLSIGTFEFIEKPGIRLGRAIIRRIERKTPEGQATAAPTEGVRWGAGRRIIRSEVRERVLRIVRDLLSRWRAVFRRRWLFITLTMALVAYVAAAPVVRDAFLVPKGRPVSIVTGAEPPNSYRMLYQVRNLDPMDDQGMYKLTGWAFLGTEPQTSAMKFNREIVLSTDREVYTYTAETTWSLDIHILYQKLGYMITQAGFSAPIYRESLPAGIFRLGILLRPWENTASQYSSLPFCIERTPNYLRLTDLDDPACLALQTGIGRPMAVDVALPAPTYPMSAVVEQVESLSVEGLFRIHGWAYPETDPEPALGEFDRRIVLISTGGNYLFPAEPVIRMEIQEYMESIGDARAVGLSGFLAYMDARIIPPGAYTVGVLLENSRDHSRLFLNTNQCMTFTGQKLHLEDWESTACSGTAMGGRLWPVPLELRG